MSSHLACTDCRPIWQAFRRDLVEVDPAQRRYLVTTYLELVHNAGHDELRVLADLRRQAEERQRLSDLVRRAVALRVVMLEEAAAR